MAKVKDVLSTLFYIFLIIFAIVVIYQIILKILGGSWETEDMIIALIILMIGFIFNMTTKLTKLESDLNNLKNSFCSLAKDFKQHLSSI